MINYFKHCFILLLIVINGVIIYRSDFYYNKIPNFVDYIILGYVLLFLVIYYFLQKNNIFTIKDARKLSKDEILEYDIIYNIISKKIYDIYVRPITWTKEHSWKKLDYDRVVSKNKIDFKKAESIERLFKISGKLLEWMERKDKVGKIYKEIYLKKLFKKLHKKLFFL